MIHIDKLIIAFNLRLEYSNKIYYQFDEISKKIELIDKENEHSELDFIEYLNTEDKPYMFNKTELKEIDLKERKTHFKNNYWVFVNNIKIGSLQWETYGNSRNYGYLNIENNTLYNGDWKLYKQAIKDLQLTISHISKLDIAYDSEINPTKRYMEILKDKENEIIINGDKISNRDILLSSPFFITYGTLNEPLKNPQIHFSTKDDSTTVKTYNKSEEIEENSHKDYIKDTFKTTEKDIYRCEVSLNVHAINRIIDDIISSEDIDVYEEGIYRFMNKVEDKTYLLELHKKSLMRLFRYSHKGKKRKTILSYYHFKH